MTIYCLDLTLVWSKRLRQSRQAILLQEYVIVEPLYFILEKFFLEEVSCYKMNYQILDFHIDPTTPRKVGSQHLSQPRIVNRKCSLRIPKRHYLMLTETTISYQGVVPGGNLAHSLSYSIHSEKNISSLFLIGRNRRRNIEYRIEYRIEILDTLNSVRLNIE